jgi:Dolichyl-phosphate-mannose-protein mannosyltransferase
MEDKIKPSDQEKATDSHIIKSDYSINNWLEARTGFIVAVIMMIGFLLRILPATKLYLNPDECLNFILVNQPNFYRVWVNTIPQAHPPLYYLILFIWKKLGDSELFLRLPSITAGTALIYVGYKWIEKCFNKSAGLLMSLLLAFAPALIALSFEVRGYTIQILFILLSFYYLQLILEEKRIHHVVLFSIFVYLSILTHYSTSFIFSALFLYFIYLLLQKNFNRKLTIIWLLFQIGTIALYGFLYLIQLQSVAKGGMRQEAIQVWYPYAFLDTNQGGLNKIFSFSVRQTIQVFQYLFSLKNLTIIVLIIFIASLIILALKRRWQFSLLLVIPFLANLVAAMLKIYPYGNMRHIVYLTPLAFAGVAYFLGFWLKSKITTIMISGIILIPLWVIFGQKPEQLMKPKNQQLYLMDQTREYILNNLPPDEIIFTDYQTSVMLGYYLAKKEIPTPMTAEKWFWQCRFAERYFVAANVWDLNPVTFVEYFQKLSLYFPIEPTDSIWIVDAGWGKNLKEQLTETFPELSFRDYKNFGENISLFKLSVNDILNLETDSIRNERLKTDSTLNILVKAAQNINRQQYRTIFWPVDRGWEAFSSSLSSYSQNIIPLRTFYRSITQENKSLEEYIPALVFWIFDDKQEHINIFSYMNEKENYIAAGYAFTLLYLAPNNLGAIYEIDRAKGNEPLINPDQK